MTGHDRPDGPDEGLPGLAPDDPLVARLRRVAESEGRRGDSEILLENVPVIEGAIAAGVEVRHVLVARRAAGDPRVAGLADTAPVSVVPTEVMDVLFQRTRVPDVFALATRPSRPRFRSLDATTGDLLVVDGVDGPGNLGSIIRSAAAFEAGGVIVLDHHHSDLYRRGVTRATAGTMFALPVMTASTADFLKYCGASGTRLVATSSHDRGDGFAELMGTTDRVAVVLGSESRGCSPEIEAAADLRCRIPMSGSVESLNVSVAAGVLLFARYRARTDAPPADPAVRHARRR